MRHSSGAKNLNDSVMYGILLKLLPTPSSKKG